LALKFLPIAGRLNIGVVIGVIGKDVLPTAVDPGVMVAAGQFDWPPFDGVVIFPYAAHRLRPLSVDSIFRGLTAYPRLMHHVADFVVGLTDDLTHTACGFDAFHLHLIERLPDLGVLVKPLQVDPHRSDDDLHDRGALVKLASGSTHGMGAFAVLVIHHPACCQKRHLLYGTVKVFFNSLTGIIVSDPDLAGGEDNMRPW
jgi:hypothetical protein